MAWHYLMVLIGSVGAIFTSFFTAHLYMKKKEVYQDVPSDPIEPDLAPITPPVVPPLPPPAPLPPKPPSMPEKVYNAAKTAIGAHLTLNPAVPPELGCVEALSVILVRSGYKLPPKGIEGVNALIVWMKAHGFEETKAPIRGAIITAHSPTYSSTEGAHCGVIMRFGICSNTSATGHWDENYRDSKAWKAAFPNSVTRYFIPV